MTFARNAPQRPQPPNPTQDTGPAGNVPCRPFATPLQRVQIPRHLAAANTSAADAPDNLLTAANTYALDIDADGWATIPYGDSHHNGRDGRADPAAELPESMRRGVVQRFDRAAADRFVSAFNSLRGRIKRAVIGLNIYRGHPDAPAYANLFPDKTPRGAIADMEAGEHGLRFRPVLTTQGAAEVEAGWNQFSPYWDLELSGVNAAGLPVYAPTKFLSLGLVPRGNIPGLSLVNAAPPAANPPNPTNPSIMNEQLIQLLAALGITLAPDADETATAAAVDQAIAAIGNLPEPDAIAETEQQLATANTALATARASVTTLTTERDRARTELATANTASAENLALANAHREARATLLVDTAIAAGRLPATERAAQQLALTNAADPAAFDTAAAALAARPRTLRTQSRLDGLTAQGREQQERSTQFISLVNAAMPKHGNDWDKAHKAVSNTTEGKQLLAGMKRAEPATA